MNGEITFQESLEIRLKLMKLHKKHINESIKVLDNKIDINVALASSSPIGVDTEEDYLALKKIMEYKV